MNIKLKDIITEANSELASSIFVDPLGLQVIWASYAEAIFRNRINSISNDVRSFTVNLMHHAVVRTLINDAGFVIPDRAQKQIGNKDNYRFSQACLLYLENVFVYSMLTAGSKEGVDTRGILGSSKGLKKLNDGNPQLTFTIEDADQILVRQSSLGVSGRYRTPFIALKFINKLNKYEFDNESKARWVKFDEFVQSSSPAEGEIGLAEFIRLACEHVKSLITDWATNNSSSLNTPPQIRLNDDSLNKLKQAYQDIFATPQKVGELTHEYWLAVTELDQGAAGALLDVLKNKRIDNDTSRIVPEVVFCKALEIAAENAPDNAKQPLQHVIEVEPFLAKLRLLFSMVCEKKSLTLQQINDKWEEFSDNENTLQSLFKAISDSAKKQLTGSAKQRFQQLAKVAQAEGLENQVTLLLQYHKRIMESRFQQPWVELKDKRTKLHARPATVPSKDEASAWVNSYYLHQFNNLVCGYFGGDHAAD